MNFLTKIIKIFYIIDEVFVKLNIKDDPQAKMLNSEVLTVAIYSALYQYSNFRKTLLLFRFLNIFTYILSESRFNRRLHKIMDKYFIVFNEIVRFFESIPHWEEEEFAIDTFPIKICENIREKRAKLVKGKEFKGYIASKKEYFYGFKLHILGSNRLYIKEFALIEGGAHDLISFDILPMNLKKGSRVYVDRAYCDYDLEDLIVEVEGIELMPIRRKNSKRFNYRKQEIAKYFRRFIETIGSKLNSYFPKKIHAVTIKGFIIKIKLFILGLNIDRLIELIDKLSLK